MRFTAPRSATAMALALGLAAPAPIVAQEAEAELPECRAEAALPCVTDTGAQVETEAELQTWIEAFPEEAAAAAQRAAEEEGAEEPEPEATAEEEESEEEPPADEEETGEEPPAEEEGAEEEEATDEGAEAPATDAPDPQAEAPEPPPEVTDTAPEASETETEEQEAATAEEETEAAPEPAAEADAEAEEPAAEAAPETAEQAEAPTEEPTEEPAAEAAPEPSDAAPTDDTAATDAPATVEDEIPEVSSAVPPETPTDTTVADDIPEVSSDVPPEAPAEGATEGMAQTDTTEPPAAAAAATAEADATAEVEETVVTEETARSSSEDFTTAIEQQEAGTDSSDDSDDRSETLQRVLAAGLAGAALVALLDQGGQVTADSGDRLVLRQDDGNLRLFRDENALLRQPGARVRTETFDDGSTRTRVLRDDGSEIVTIRAADGTLLRRTRILPDGREVLLIDDMEQSRPVEVAELPDPQREVVRYTGDEDELRLALARAVTQDVGRSFSLRQIREIDRVRYLAPEIEIDAITFASGSAAIQPDQAQQLAVLGRALVALVEENPGEVFLVEGHTDAVGDASYNLALSDRRAESVALALTEYFDVPPENLVVQGYGEFDLKVPTTTAERENRRANVRRITGLLGIESAGLR